MTSTREKGGAGFHGIKLLLCENPLPPLDEAIAAAATAALPEDNARFLAALRPLLGQSKNVGANVQPA